MKLLGTSINQWNNHSSVNLKLILFICCLFDTSFRMQSVFVFPSFRMMLLVIQLDDRIHVKRKKMCQQKEFPNLDFCEDQMRVSDE